MTSDKGKGKAKELLIIFVIFLIAFIFIYMITMAENIIHADETSELFVAWDIFQNGNILLKNWSLSTGLFMLPAFSIGLWGSIFGYSYTLLYVLSAVHFSFLVTVLAYVSGHKEKGFDYVTGALTACLVLIPRSHSILNAGTQTLAYAMVALVLFATYQAFQTKAGKVLKCVIVLTSGFLMVTNTVMPYYILVPMIGLAGIDCYVEKRLTSKGKQLVLMAVAESVIWRMGIWGWTIARGRSFDTVKEVFTTKEGVVGNCVQVLSNIMEEFGIKVWGENLFSKASIKAGIGVLVILMVAVTIRKYYNACQRKDLVILFLMASFTSLAAYGLSSLPVYSASTHLMEPFGFYLCAAYGIILRDCRKCVNIKVTGALIVLYVLVNMPALALRPQPSPLQPVTEYLVSNNYTTGFATYWEASPLMLESQGQLTTAPITVYYNTDINSDGNIIGPQLMGWKWMAKDEWLEQEGSYIVMARDNPYGVTLDLVYKDYGVPSQIVEMDKYCILLWDEPFTLMGSYR